MTRHLRKAGIAALLATSLSTSAYAGGMAEPIVEAETIVEDTAASSISPLVLGILALILIGIAVSGGGGDDPFI